MSSTRSSSPSPGTKYKRAKLLHNHLQQALQADATSSRSQWQDGISQSLALAAASRALTTHHDHEIRAPGGLTQDELRDLAPVPPLELSHRLCRRLELEFEQTLLSISSYLSADEQLDATREDRLDSALHLPERIRMRREAIARQEESLRDSRARVLDLIERVNAAYPVLEVKLTHALKELPPELRAVRRVQADLAAATIEAALLKLSLVRARAYRTLYFTPHNSSSSSVAKQGPTVAQAVNATYERLRERQAAQETEMEALDAQIAEYDAMLRLVDGRDGSFAQVVKDMARVKRETEECRRDLRRLGWTGD